MNIRTNLLALAALAVAAAGCGHTNYTTPARYEQGLVVVLGGAGGGMMGEDKRVQSNLASAGINRAIEIFKWSQGDVMDDQTDMSRNRQMADELSRRIEDYVATHPGRPVHVVAISAGTGVAIWAIEDLPSGMKVTGAVLMASSLDAKYDLASALSKVDDAIYSFNSVADAVLGLGVAVTKTVDRGGSVSGGLVGFSPPKDASESERKLYKDKLVQIPWWPGDVVLGNPGDHLGTTNPLFIRAKVAPLVLGRTHRGHQVATEETAGQSTTALAARTPGDGADQNKTEKTAGGAEKSRFTDWAVAVPPPGPRATDEAAFFSDSGNHP
jgi:pimeloyl-ACP methyl ester carboxylesterase